MPRLIQKQPKSDLYIKDYFHDVNIKKYLSKYENFILSQTLTIIFPTLWNLAFVI